MIASYNKVQNGIAKFMDAELLPQFKAESGIKAFGISLFAALAVKRTEEMLKDLRKYPLIDALGVVTDDGVEIDALKEAAEKAFPQSGLEIDIPMVEKRMRFTRGDVDTIYRYILEG